MEFRHRVIILCLCFLYLTAVDSDLASDRAALLALRAAVGGRSRLWNLTASPCSWFGVHCFQDRVVELRLPGGGLIGQLPIAIGNLTQLQTLSLRFNALSGQIPPDFANLNSLRNLYLQGNELSGQIPEFLFSLQNLIRLNLAKNNFSGPIPSNVNNLTRLSTLYLEENQLNGSIPDINLQLEQFNVSFNRLNGSIPKSLSGQPASAFNGNSLCGKPLLACNGTESGKKLSGAAITGIVIACVFVLLLILAILIFLCKRRKGKSSRSPNLVSTSGEQTAAQIPRSPSAVEIQDKSSGVTAPVSGDQKGKTGLVFFGTALGGFDLEELLRASAEVLGKGTFGTAYKATFEAGLVVVVKRLKDVPVAEKEFREKMEAVGAMRHENLVPLRAYYYSKDEKLLVFDYMPRGSFSALLHGNRGAGRTPLNWETRVTIALGAARAITYIHSQGPTISHGNIKSSNILLSDSYEARVSDYCVAQVVISPSTPNRVDGYRAPEVTDLRKVSQKADVYSFGVLLLELLTGKSPTHPQLNEDGVDLPRWVQSIVEQEWSAEVFDIELVRYQTVEDNMVKLLQLAINCAAQYPDKRPSMTEVSKQIEELCHAASQKD